MVYQNEHLRQSIQGSASALRPLLFQLFRAAKGLRGPKALRKSMKAAVNMSRFGRSPCRNASEASTGTTPASSITISARAPNIGNVRFTAESHETGSIRGPKRWIPRVLGSET